MKSIVKLSIIIPVYNAEQYLSHCLDSIGCQHFDEFEVLLIDDGSTDSSSKICDEYAQRDTKFKVFHQTNGGVSSARNRGLDKAEGEWIYFVDADDWLEQDTFSDFFKIIAEHADIDIYKFGYYKEYPHKVKYTCDDTEKIIRNSTDMLLVNEKNHYYAYVWNMIFKKELAEAVRFDEKISWCEDHIFSLTLYAKAHCMLVNNKMYYHYTIRNWGDSLSFAKHNPYMLRDAIWLEAKAKKACLATPDSAIIAAIDHTANVLMKNAIRSLYHYTCSYKRKKEFFESINKKFNPIIDVKYLIKYKLYYLHIYGTLNRIKRKTGI